jgi:fatty acid desaturase
MKSPTVSLKDSVEALKPSWLSASLIFGWVAFCTGVGVFLSLQAHFLLWILGQIVFGVAMFQWFVVLHETGHNSFFPHLKTNVLVGHIASLFAFIPFHSWRLVHHQHHLWTGWRDLDPTMTQTVPRPLQNYEKAVMNFCWRFWLPLFSILYRTGSYWNWSKLKGLFPSALHRRKILFSMGVLFVSCLAMAIVLGPIVFLRVFVGAFFVQLILADPILVSQHTHIELKFDRGAAKATPIPFLEQEVFTRSLLSPTWVSRLIFFNFDHHGLHHLFPRVPGYFLHRIPSEAVSAFPLFAWIRKVKRVPAHILVFHHRGETGLDV